MDWAPFDIAAVDAYRDASDAGTFRAELRTHLGHGKPLAITEYGCCGYAGAACRGGMGWAIIDRAARLPATRAWAGSRSSRSGRWPGSADRWACPPAEKLRTGVESTGPGWAAVPGTPSNEGNIRYG